MTEAKKKSTKKEKVETHDDNLTTVKMAKATDLKEISEIQTLTEEAPAPDEEAVKSAEPVEVTAVSETVQPLQKR